MKNIIIKPRTMAGRVCHNKMHGSGMGSVLLNGSAGDAGSYTNDSPSVPSLTQTSGGSLGKSIASKLDKLRIQSKKKPENIRFSI